MFDTANVSELPALRGALSALGCGDSEIKTYEVLLESGHRPASFIARKVGMNRVYAYDVLSTLERKGLVFSYERNSVTHFASLPPREIVSHLHEQEERLVTMRHELTTFVEQLAAEAEQATVPSVNVFRGADACEKAIRRLQIADGESVRVLGNPVLLAPNRESRWRAILSSRLEEKGAAMEVVVTSATPIPPQSNIGRVAVRHAKEEPLPCQLIVTRHSLVILLENDRTAMVLQQGIFSEIVIWIHRSLWRKAA